MSTKAISKSGEFSFDSWRRALFADNLNSHGKMILPILANVEWASAAVAITIILVFGGVTAIALHRYTTDELLKLWSSIGPAVGTIAGLVIGTFGTYFFARQATEAKVQAAQTELSFALKSFEDASAAVKTKLSPEDAKWFDEMIHVPTAQKSGETPKQSAEWRYQIYRSPKSPTPTP